MTVTEQDRPTRAIPPVGPLPELPLPPTVDTRLANGLRVVAVRRAAVPLVELRLRVPFNGVSERHLPTATLLSDALLSGTAAHDKVTLAATVQRMGGSLSASTDADHLAVGGSVLAAELPGMLDLMGEVLTGAAYPDGEVAGERDRLIQRLTVARSQPGRRARDALLQRLYGGHPYGKELPEVDEVATVDPASLRALHADRVVPEGATLVLVGDLDPEAVAGTVASALGGWEGTRKQRILPPPPPPQPGPTVLVDRPGSVQTTIRMGGRAPDRRHPDHPAFKLANLVFGGYFSSRLVANIRERRGYTYSPHSGLEHAASASTLVIAADVATAVTAPALMEIAYELGRVVTLPVEEAELEAAKRYAVGSLALSTATQAGLASTLAALVTDGLDGHFLVEHPRALQAVTLDQVRAAARTWLAPAGLLTVLLGDAEAVRADVAALGPLAEG
jgi:zinc protease